MKTGNAWTRWRKVLAAIAVVASGMCSAAMAYTETVDGVVWTYSISEGTAIVEKASPANGSLTIPSALGGVPVTRIKYYAFANCYNLTSVTIPDSVISIEAAAFSYCSCLTNVTFGIGVKRVQGDAFRHCEKLSSVHIRDLAAWCGISFKDFNSDANPLYPCYFNEKNHTISPGAHLFLDGVAVTGNLVIPDGVVSIANHAFYGLTNVTSVVIPTSVTKIGECAFSECGLTNALIPGSVESIERYAFSWCRGLTNLTLGNGLRSIGEGAFEYCSGLMRVKIPDSVVSIGKSAFSRCLSSLYDTSTLPGVVLVDGWAVGWTNSLAGHVDLTGVRGISAGAFSNCTALASVAIPGTMKEIGNRTFADCTGLRNVAIPDSVESIGGWAFYGCTNLTSVAIPDSVESIGDGAFGKCPSLYDTQTIPGVCLVDGWALEGTNSLSGDLMLTEVRGIAERAFYNCSNLTSVTIGSAVKSIGYATFRGCERLDEVVIPGTVREIGDEAFAFCYSLDNVVIPDGVKSIGTRAFSKCYLTNALISSSVRIIGDYAFTDCSSLCSATICEGVETIGEGAFDGCNLLSNLTIPESTVNIGWDAFKDCKMLKWLYVPASREETWALAPKGVERDKVVFYRTDENGGVPWRYAVLDGVATVVGSRFSGGDLSVPETLADYPVEAIGAYAFSQCSVLTNVTLPDSVTSIGDHAFRDCSALANVRLGNRVTDIGSYAFYDCSGLTAVTVPDSVANIGESAFSGCSRMVSATIGNGVTDIGYGAFCACGGLTAITIPDSVTNIGVSAFDYCSGLGSVSIGNGVTYIGSYAFCGCSGLTDVTIPDSVMKIGSYVFQDCTGLTTLEVPGAWYGTTVLKNAGVPDGCKVTYRGNPGAKWTYFVSGGAATVTGVSPAEGDLSIPSTLEEYPVTCIGESAFSGCTNLASMTIPDCVTNIDRYAFRSCTGLTNLTIGNGVVGIGYGALYNCNGLTDLVIPDSVTWIGEQAFSDCVRLVDVTVGNGVTLIGNHAFSACSRLTNMTLPDSVTSIGRYAFVGCSSLAKVTIPDSVTNIGEKAFYGCTGLTTLEVPGEWYGTTILEKAGVPDGCKVTYRGISDVPPNVEWSYSISGGGATVTGASPAEGDLAIPSTLDGYPVRCIGEGAFYGCTNLTSMTIPDSVTDIDRYAFRTCIGLTNLTIGNGVTDIGYGAFYNCPGLTNLVIPDSVTWIGEQAFSACSGLESLTIGNSVEFIGNYAFSACYSLMRLAIPDSVTRIGNHAFYNCGLRVLYVPASWEGTTMLYNTDVDCPVVYGAMGRETLSGVAWTYCVKDGTAMVAWASPTDGDVTIPSTLGGYPVTDIGGYAFYACANLEGVTVPDSVTVIGGYAFSGCSGMGGVTIGDGVTNIGNGAFYDCSGLAGITIPDSVASIGEEAFYGCPALQDTSTLPGVILVDGWAIGWGASIPGTLELSGVRGIAGGAFYYCDSLTNVTLGDSVADIGDYAFYMCTNLAKVSIGSRATRIGNAAFDGCIGLENVVIPDSVADIGSYAFSDCTGLSELTLSDGVANVGYRAFWGSALETLYVPASWEGTEMLTDAAVPEGCAIVYVSDSPPGPKPQSLDWAPTGTGHVPGDRVVLSATAGGGGEVQFEVMSGPGVVEGKTLSFTAAGSVTVRAFQPGDEDWLPVEETREVDVAAITEDGRRVYADLAANYPGGWRNGSNGGEGFGAWRFDVRDGSDGGWAGGGIWDPSANGFAGTWTGKTNAFGLIGKGAGFAIRTSRSFMRALGPDDSFSLEMAVNWDSNMDGAEKGFALTAGEKDVVVVNHGSYPGNISVNGDSSYDAVNVYGLHPMAWTFTVVDGNTLRFTATGRDDPANTATGILKVVTSAIDGFRLQSAGQYALDANQWEGDCRQSYYDDFRLFLVEGGTEPPPVSVPKAWLEENASAILEANGGDPEAAASAPAANGLPVWKCYVAGLATTNAEAAFKVKSISVVDGEVNVEWDPDLNGNGTPNARAYTVEGKPTMADDWGPRDASSRFFRIRVELPQPE